MASYGGLSVLGVDSDPAKVESLAQSISYIGHVPSEAVASVIRLGRFRTTLAARGKSHP